MQVLLRNKCRIVFDVGAGISTAAGIGDYRGKSGKWTEMDHCQVTDKIQQLFDNQGPSPSKKHCPDKESTDNGTGTGHLDVGLF
jgi:NAD-dependent SIR2 family protein deacetylase